MKTKARTMSRRPFRLLSFGALAAIALGAVSCRWVGDYYIAGYNFRRQDYPYAVSRYQRFLDRYDKPKVRREIALINLGQAYMKMRAYHDAARIFEQYEREFPDGRFIDTARQALSEVRRIGESRRQELARKVAQAQKEAERLKAELEKRPNDPELLVALGNAFYAMGQYKSAGEAYLKAIEIKPDLRNHPLLQERLIFDLDGNLVPVDPQQRIALERERKPLEIVDLYEDERRAGSDFFSARRRYKIVAGTIRNRSTRPILGVRIEVTLYDSLEQILDVKSYNMGTLYPQERRSFIVKFDLDAETMNRYRRFKCRLSYKQ